MPEGNPLGYLSDDELSAELERRRKGIQQAMNTPAAVSAQGGVAKPPMTPAQQQLSSQLAAREADVRSKLSGPTAVNPPSPGTSPPRLPSGVVKRENGELEPTFAPPTARFDDAPTGRPALTPTARFADVNQADLDARLSSALTERERQLLEELRKPPAVAMDESRSARRRKRN